MAIICPNCGAEFDATLFEFGHRIRCDCRDAGRVSGSETSQGRTITQGKAAAAPRSAPSGEFGGGATKSGDKATTATHSSSNVA